MPVETSNDTNGEKYQKILDTLTLDSNSLHDEGIISFLYGDMNAHVGTPEEDPLGVAGNKKGIGHNGHRLLAWLKFQDKTLVNSLPSTQGLWTYQSSSGRTLSVLDFMISDNENLPYVKGLIIDDNREATTINNDHNLLISIVKADYQKIQWQKAKPRCKWDTKNINKNVFKDSLESSLKKAEETRVKNGNNNSPVALTSDVTHCILSSLKASTRLVTSTTKRPKISQDIVLINEKIQEAEQTRANILKVNGGSSASLDSSKQEELKTLTQRIKDLRHQKDDVFLCQSKKALVEWSTIMGMGKSPCNIFKFQRKTIVSRLRSYAGLILQMAKESFDPIEVGEAMWKSIALEAVLYGIQVISLNEQILTKLDSIQANFAADLLQVKRSCSHVGLLRELGWVPLSSLVAKRKLAFWTRLCSLKEENWARKALEDCMSARHPTSGAWHSKYRNEILQLHTKYQVGFILKDGHTPKKNVVQSVEKFWQQEMASMLADHRKHSLKYLPDYPEGMGR